MDTAYYLFYVPSQWDTTGYRWARILAYIQHHNLQVVENAMMNILYIYDAATCQSICQVASEHGTNYVLFQRV